MDGRKLALIIAAAVVAGWIVCTPGVRCLEWDRQPTAEDQAFFKERGVAWKAKEQWPFLTTSQAFTEQVTTAIRAKFGDCAIHVTDRKAFVYTRSRVDRKWLQGEIDGQKLATVKMRAMTREKWIFLAFLAVVGVIMLMIPTRPGTNIMGKGVTVVLLLATLSVADMIGLALVSNNSCSVGKGEIRMWQNKGRPQGLPKPTCFKGPQGPSFR